MKRKIMIILSVALILCLTMAFVGCGGGDTNTPSSVPQSPTDSSIAGGENSNNGGTTGSTDNTVPSTDNTVTSTDNTVPSTDNTVPPTDSSVPPTDSSVPGGDNPPDDKPCEHNFVSVSKQDPTCKDDGYESFECSACGETKSETLPKVETHDYAVTEEIAANCQHPKIIVKVCGVCDDRQEIEEGDKGPHTQEVIVVKEATCTEDGERAAQCDVCGCAMYDPRLEKVIPKLGHDFTEFVKNVKPTCVEEGYDLYKCVRCDETSRTKTADPHGNHGYARATVDGLIACYMCGKGYRDVTTEVTTEEDAFCMGCGKDPCECGSVGESNGYTPAKAPYELTANTEFTITEVTLSDGTVALAIGNGMIVLTGTKETTYTVSIYSAIDGEAVNTYEVSGNYVLVDLVGYEQVCKVQITASTDATAQFYAPEN